MTIQRPLAAGLCLLAGSFLSPSSSRAAESYDACAGYIDSLPAVISTQGNWCLRGDLSTGMTSGAAIQIEANNVTIDCNHFKIGGLAAGPTSNAIGIFSTSRINATVRRCNLRGFNVAIFLNAGGHLVEENRLDGNLYAGMIVSGTGNLVRNNRVFDTGGSQGTVDSYGISAEADVVDNIVDGVFADSEATYPIGIYITGPGSLARDNRVRNLVVAGQGSALGIWSGDTSARIDNNHVASAFLIVGTAISSSGPLAACTRNTIANFTTGIQGCGSMLDNIQQGVVP